MSQFDKIAQSLIGLDVSRTADLTRVAIKDGVAAIEILNQGLLPGMKIVGEQFRCGEIYLPEVFLAGKAMKGAMALLKPAFQKEGAPSRGTVAVGTVKDDIHDIGKNLVIMMLEGNGWEVTDLGKASLEAAGLREKVKIMVGGAIVTQAFAIEIGADGYAPNAVEAVELADRLLNK